MTRPVTFRQSDVERALAALQAKDIPIAGVHINSDGSVSILTTAPKAPEPQATPLEEWRKARGRSAA